MSVVFAGLRNVKFAAIDCDDEVADVDWNDFASSPSDEMAAVESLTTGEIGIWSL